jgi:glycine/D-amino acid oxidase-like deaminating enzyme
MNTQQKALILGGGLAGTTLSIELINRGLHVTVISNDEMPSASRVAAGVYNPMVFKRLTLTPLAMTATLEATKFYKEFEVKYQHSVLSQIPMVRVFQSAGESNDFAGLTNNEKYKNHLALFDDKIPNTIHAPFGCGKIISAGRLNVLNYLEACKKIIEKQGVWKNQFFNELKRVARSPISSREWTLVTRA